MERAAFRSDEPSPSLRRDLPRAMLAMLTSVPVHDQVRRGSNLSSAAHNRATGEREREWWTRRANGRVDFEWEGEDRKRRTGK